MVLPDCDEAGAVALAERVRESIEADAMVLAEGMVPITFSLGVATSKVAQEPEALIGAADTALYRAKNNGRNRVELATEADVARNQEVLVKGSMA